MGFFTKKTVCLSAAALLTTTAGFQPGPSFAQNSELVECANFLMQDNRTVTLRPSFVPNSTSPNTDWLGDTYYTLPQGVSESMVEDQNEIDLLESFGDELAHGTHHATGRTSTLQVFIGITREAALDQCR